MDSTSTYKLIQLANGKRSLFSTEYQETMHPALGPAAEAEQLYVRQLRLPERVLQERWDFVVWDIGLGGAANALAVLRATQTLPCSLWLASFDSTSEPLEFALRHRRELGYLDGFEDKLEALVSEKKVSFKEGGRHVRWDFHMGDFPALLTSPVAPRLPKPHAILFDAFSPARNPAMWTLPLFTNLFQLLDPGRPCSLSTYSRSTMFRVTLLLAGFFVGLGHPTGQKEETTIAANSLSLIEEPLSAGWLERAQRSGSAEPLRDPVYRQAPLEKETLERLRKHPQFV